MASSTAWLRIPVTLMVRFRRPMTRPASCESCSYSAERSACAALAQYVGYLALGVQAAGGEHFGQQLERAVYLALYGADARGELGAVSVRAALVDVHGEVHAAAVELQQAAELLRAVRGGVYLAEQLSEEADAGQL